MHLKKDGKDQSSESVVDGSTRYFETDHLLADISRRTVRGSIVTMSTHGLKFGISIIATAILARLLTPQDYGLIGMVAVATNLVSLLKEMGLSYPTVQRAEIDFRQISTLFWVNLGVSIAMIAVMLALAPVLSWFYGEPRLKMIASVTAIGFVFGGLTVQHEALLRRQMRFLALSGIAFVSMLSGYFVAIVMAWSGAGHWSALNWRCWQLALSASYFYVVGDPGYRVGTLGWLQCSLSVVMLPAIRSLTIFRRIWTTC